MSIKIFISHSSADEPLAAALVRCILDCIQLDDDELRCSSVGGHRLPFGVDIPLTIKNELASNSSVVLGLVTPSALASTWVLFELGAAWGSGKTIFPLIAGNLEASRLPGPIAGLNFARASSEDNVVQMIDNIRQVSGCQMRDPTRVYKAVKEFVEKHNEFCAAGNAHVPIPPVIAQAVEKYKGGTSRDRINADLFVEENAAALDYKWLLTINNGNYGRRERAMMAKAMATHPARDQRALEALLAAVPSAPAEGGTYAYRILTSLRKLLLEGFGVKGPRPGEGGPDLAPVFQALDHLASGEGKDTPIVATEVKRLLQKL